jgi:hypothetical protein
MDMTQLQKEPNQPRYALTVIDIFSKKADALPMKNKDSNSVYGALLNIFKTMGYPMSVYSDEDSAFKSKEKELFNDEGIEHITTRNHANVIERFIRTIKNMIHDRLRNNDRQWQDILPFVINKYNNTVHSSSGMTPNQGHNDNNRVSVATNLAIHSINKRKYPSLSIGSKVKIYTKGHGNYTSRKETTSRWSEHIYTIDKIDRDMLLNTYYMIDGSNRHYNRSELLLIV